MTHRSPSISTPQDVDARLRELYGEVDWPSATGVVHVAAIDRSSRAVIIPGEHAPESDTDRFVLAAARARADAIVTTGAILRSEPELRHDPSPLSSENFAFGQWRRTRLGRSSPPLLIVLTASGEMPEAHPALAAATEGFVWTTSRGRARLEDLPDSTLGDLEIVEERAGQRKGIEGAIDAAYAWPGRRVETILIECGPGAAAPLYAMGRESSDRTRCDELLLDLYAGELAPEALGPSFFSAAVIDDRFPDPPHETQIEDRSGSWTLSRRCAPKTSRSRAAMNRD